MANKEITTANSFGDVARDTAFVDICVYDISPADALKDVRDSPAGMALIKRALRQRRIMMRQRVPLTVCSAVCHSSRVLYRGRSLQAE
jgi:hypothetical protein